MTQPSLHITDSNSLDIWSVSLSSSHIDIASLEPQLDANEFQRYQRLHKKHQYRYLVSHAACRQILSRYTGIASDEITYTTNSHGKPALKDHAICFNLSHSHDLAVIAIGHETDIGVDVEYEKSKPSWKKLAHRFFHPTEYQHLLNLAEEKQLRAFFQLWTRKEAFIKALGTGLSTPLSSFDVTSHKVVFRDENKNTDSKCWYQQDLTLAAPYIGSVNQNTKIKKIRYYSYA